MNEAASSSPFILYSFGIRNTPVVRKSRGFCTTTLALTASDTSPAAPKCV